MHTLAIFHSASGDFKFLMFDGDLTHLDEIIAGISYEGDDIKIEREEELMRNLWDGPEFLPKQLSKQDFIMYVKMDLPLIVIGEAQ